MKNSLLTLALSICLAGAFLPSCDSPAKNVKDAEMDLDRAQRELAAHKRDSVQKADWLAFKATSQENIAANSLVITELKSKKKHNGKATNVAFENQIQTLENRNNLLQGRIDDYEKYNNSWEVFKREFSQDMDDLGEALKGFAVETLN